MNAALFARTRSARQSQSQVFILTLRAARDDGVRALRALLKRALRSYGLIQSSLSFPNALIKVCAFDTRVVAARS